MVVVDDGVSVGKAVERRTQVGVVQTQAAVGHQDRRTFPDRLDIEVGSLDAGSTHDNFNQSVDRS